MNDITLDDMLYQLHKLCWDAKTGDFNKGMYLTRYKPTVLKAKYDNPALYEEHKYYIQQYDKMLYMDKKQR